MLEVRDDKVWLTNRTHDGLSPEPLLEVPGIFEDFIHTLEGGGLGVLDAADAGTLLQIR